MAGFETPFEKLPEIVPVFPLTGALLLPHSRLPLNIFEPRYLAMIDDALAAGRFMGMIQPNPLAPAVSSGPGLYRVGCLGRIAAFSETDDGRYLITLAGVIRFTIIEEMDMRRGYRRVRAEFGGFDGDLAIQTDEAHENPSPSVSRPALLQSLQRYFHALEIEVNWEAIDAMPGPALVATLCMACPFTPQEKQALLEAADDAERAKALLALLEIGAREAGGSTRPGYSDRI
jgi:Lon protease-like protein